MSNEHISRPSEPPELSDAAKQLRKDTARVRDLADMLRTPGWKHLEELIRGNIDDRTKNIFDVPAPDYKVELDWHNKGAIYGLLYVLHLPSVIVSAHKDATRSVPATEDDEDE